MRGVLADVINGTAKFRCFRECTDPNLLRKQADVRCTKVTMICGDYHNLLSVDTRRNLARDIINEFSFVR